MRVSKVKISCGGGERNVTVIGVVVGEWWAVTPAVGDGKEGKGTVTHRTTGLEVGSWFGKREGMGKGEAVRVAKMLEECEGVDWGDVKGKRGWKGAVEMLAGVISE